MVTDLDLDVKTLGPCTFDSPLGRLGAPRFVDDRERILYDDRLAPYDAGTPTLELAGPRRHIFFDPARTRIGIVTCGGLCPGLNDVIRGLVMEAHHRYGIAEIDGFRYGLQGFISAYGHPVEALAPERVSEIHLDGGTILGSSRGDQDVGAIVDRLVARQIDILFVIGGDGTMRAALAILAEAERRQLRLSVVGIPKTIDNDVHFIDRSFGFETAYSEAVEAIYGAHQEARGAPNGVGLVKLMGRHSGFLACHATLATSQVNFCLVPEVPFTLAGEGGFLAALRERLRRRQHAVIVVAEGAGQHLIAEGGGERDASGNVKLKDVGPFLAQAIKDDARQHGLELNLKYIDPSYIVRSVPARPPDSVLCWRLAQNAVHAAMSGRTQIVIGEWHGRMVHVPMEQTIRERKQVDPNGDLWLSVLEATGQPPVFT